MTMTKKKSAKTIEGQLIIADPRPKSERIRLGNIKDVRYEIAKVYREARAGLMPTQEATRLVYMLISLGNMIRDSELEERIVKLEKLKND